MNRWTFPVLLFVASVTGLGLGATLPLVALRMLDGGASALQIGVIAALPAVGMVVAALMCSAVSRRFGAGRLYRVCLAACVVSIALLELGTLPLYLCGLLRLAMGTGLGLIVILSESWVNELCTDANRGKTVALYTTLFTGSQLLGPCLIALFGYSGPWVVVAVSATFALAWLGVMLAVAPPHAHEPAPASAQCARQGSLFSLLAAAPTLCLGVMFFSFFDSVILAMFPVYGAANGHEAAVASFMVTVILLGDMACQLPLGWLADRLDRQRLHLCLGVVVLALGAALPWLMASNTLLWPALLVLGAAAGGVYTLAIVQIGQRFRGQALVAANASAGLLWGIGSVIGPLASGGLMQISRHGLPITLAIMAGLFVCTALTALKRRRLSPSAAGRTRESGGVASGRMD